MDRIKVLRDLLNTYNIAYYTNDNPLITDSEYDALMQELIALERQYPESYDINSPSLRIGGIILDEFKKVNHRNKMYSLSNIFSKEELENWINKIEQEIGSCTYCVECKIDGLAMAVHYKNGEFVLGATRGDGEVGEDVSNNVRTITSLPLSIDVKEELEIRGEVFMSIDQFNYLNQQKIQQGEDVFANPRNAAAGTIRQLDSSIAASRKLDAFWYHVSQAEKLGCTSHYESIQTIKQLGFKVNPLTKLCSSSEEIWQHIENIGNQRDTLAYAIDGVVIKVDSLNNQQQLGFTQKSPKWAVAYKFKAMEATTIVEDIFITVGRTGKATPNAKLTPVFVAGSLISYATLHNEDMIIAKDIRVFDEVVIHKAGDVIPEVLCSLKDKRDHRQQPYVFATECPQCHMPLVRDPQESAHYCINIDCPARIVNSIAHFASRDAMNIDGLGEKRVEALHKAGLITHVSDIYDLKNKKSDLYEIEKMGEKSINNLLDAIEESKNNSLERCLFGLGIRQVGSKAAKVLASHFKTLDNIRCATLEQLSLISDIGPITATSIIDFFADESNIAVVESLMSAGVNSNYIGKDKKESVFTNKKVVLTGTLSTLDRTSASELLNNLGALVTSSVSKKTDYVIAGSDAGSKLEKARQCNVEVITEEQFLKMIEGESYDQ